jgi:hypothetical protein
MMNDGDEPAGGIVIGRWKFAGKFFRFPDKEGVNMTCVYVE